MKIFCVGRNYADHAKEMNSPVPEEPVIFMKPDTALLKNNQVFYYPDFSKDIHYEAEIVLRISKQGKNIQEKFAYKYYDQCTIGIDFTARDIQKKCKDKGLPWELAKAFDNSAAVGEMIDLNEKDKKGIEFGLSKNKHIVQKGNTNDMIFTFDQIVSFVSRYFTLRLGDLIFTGTPVGVGPVVINDVLEGYIRDKKLLCIDIK